LEANQKLTCPKCGATFLTPRFSAAVQTQTQDDDLFLEGESPATRPQSDASIEKTLSKNPAADRRSAAAQGSSSPPQATQATSPAVPSKQEQGASRQGPANSEAPQHRQAPANRDDLGPLRLDDDLLDSEDESSTGTPRGPDRTDTAAAGSTGASTSTARSPGYAQPGRVPASLMVYTTGNSDSSATPPELPVAQSADHVYFSFPCRICGTLHECDSTQIGATVECPDCQTPAIVPTPTPSQIRKQFAAGEHDDGTTLQLSAATDAVAKTVPTSTAAVSGADYYLKKATATMAREEEEEREAQAVGDLTEVFQFAIQPGTLLRLAVFSFGLWLIVALIEWAGLRADEKAPSTSDLVRLFLFPILAITIAVWFSAVTASLLAITRDTGSGGKQISWPSASFTEWMFEGITVVIAVAFSCLPAELLGTITASAGKFQAAWPYVFALATLCLVTIHPVVMLSMMHGGSHFSLLSTAVLRSFSLSSKFWITFYQISFFCGIVFYGTGRFLMQGSLSRAAILSPIAIANLFLYYRMLGWLGWHLAELGEEIAETPKPPENQATP